jgi:hypothetical protein
MINELLNHALPALGTLISAVELLVQLHTLRKERDNRKDRLADSE